jgi:MFS transporter, DHA2 family, multidrug resistance protein
LPAPESSCFRSKVRQVDWVGLFLIVSGLASLILGLALGSQSRWQVASTVGLLTFGVLGIVAGLVWERRFPGKSFIRLSIFNSWSLAAALVATFLHGLVVSFSESALQLPES